MVKIKRKHHATAPNTYAHHAAFSIGLGSGIFTALFLLGVILATIFINGLYHWFILATPVAAGAYATLASLAALCVKLLKCTQATPRLGLFIIHFIVFFVGGALIMWLWAQDNDPDIWFNLPMATAVVAAIQAPFYRRFLPIAPP